MSVLQSRHGITPEKQTNTSTYRVAKLLKKRIDRNLVSLDRCDYRKTIGNGIRIAMRASNNISFL